MPDENVPTKKVTKSTPKAEPKNIPPKEIVSETSNVKNKALVRLAIAGVVTSAALAGLWWLDQSESKPNKQAVAITPAPTPIISAPQTALPPPEKAEEIPEVVPEEVAEPTEPIVESPPKKTPNKAVDTPAKRTVTLPHPPQARQIPQGPTPIRQAAPQSTPKPTAQPLPTPPSLPKPFPQAALPSSTLIEKPKEKPTTPTPSLPMQREISGKNYVVQLGVFNNAEGAIELVEKLKKQGIQAHIETRVQIGPFKGRLDAEKAQAEMRKLGYNALITLPYLTK